MPKYVIIAESITDNVLRMFEELDSRGIEYNCLTPRKIFLLEQIISKVDGVINLSNNIELDKYIDPTVRVFNPPKSVYTCGDKWLTYLKLYPYDIEQPFTSKDRRDFPKLPYVMKHRKGSLGEQVYLVKHSEEVSKARSKIGPDVIYQEFISTSYGVGLKAMVIGGEVVTCVIKRSDGFIANMHQGCKTEVYEMSELEKELCKQVSDVLGMDYCGIDILFGENGKPIVCEVNANAIVSNIEEATDFNVMGAYIDYILSQTK